MFNVLILNMENNIMYYEDNSIEEIWKDVPDYEGQYQVSNMGGVRSLDRYTKGKNNSLVPIKGKELKARLSNNGYLQIPFSKSQKKKRFTIHRLVMLAFIGPSKLYVDHINGDKTDNRLVNLEYVTPRENATRYCKTLNSTSKYTGVSKYKNKWKALIYVQGKDCFLGYHDTEEEAHSAYQRVLKELN